MPNRTDHGTLNGYATGRDLPLPEWLQAQQEAERPKIYTVGVDLAKKRDFTAICVLQSMPNGIFNVVFLDRWRGLSYVETVNQIAALAGSQVLAKPARATLTIDGSGLGAVVSDMLNERNIRHIAITSTAGQNASQDIHGWNVPRSELMGSLVVLTNTQRLKVSPALPLAKELLSELSGFKLSYSDAGKVQIESEAPHDDLAAAAALASWYALRTARRGQVTAKVHHGYQPDS